MNELEPNNKRIFLYETKLNIEQKIRSNILGYSKEHEKKWYTEA